MHSNNKRRITGRKSVRAFLAAATGACAGTLVPTIAAGADFSWDADGQLPVNGGHGAWNLTDARWWNGAGFVPWTLSAGNNAYFGGGGRGSAQLAQISAPHVAGQLSFDADYRLYRPRVGLASLSISTIDTGPNRVETIASFGSSFTKLGSGMLIVHSGNGTFGGTINVNAGTLAYGNSADADFSSTTIFNIAAGAALDLGTWAGGFYSDTIGNIQGAGNIHLGTVTGLGQNTGGGLTAGIAGGSVEFSGSITGGGGFIKQGSGTTVLSGANSLTGGVFVHAGALRLTSEASLPTNTELSLSAVLGTRLLLDTSKALGSITAESGTPTISLGANTLTVGSANTDRSCTALIVGTGTVVKTGEALWSLGAGASNPFAGKYRVEDGTLIFAADNAIGVVPGAATPDAITLAGGVLASRAFSTFNVNALRGITVSADSGIAVINGGTSTFRVNGPISGSHTLSKTGPGKLAIEADNALTFSGDWIANDGTIGTSNALATRPFGTGGFDVTGAQIDVLPANAAISVTTELAPGNAKVLQFGPGTVLNTFKGGTNTNLTVNIGDAAATGTTLVRKPNGSVVVNAQSGLAAFGTPTGEMIHVNGGANLVNGVIPGLVVTDGLADTAGDLVSYNGSTMTVASYSSTDLSASIATDTVNQLTPVTLAANASAYALRVGNSATAVALGTGGNQINVGDGTDNPAQLILNQGSSISGGGTIHFGSREGLVYTQSQSGGATISSTINGTAGMHKIGAGALHLTSPANYTGTTTISQGSLSVHGNDLLPAGTAVVLRHTGVLSLNGTSQTVASINGTNRGANIDMGLNGVLTVGAGDMQYLGTMSNGTGSTASTLGKDGVGRLTLGFVNSAIGQQSPQLRYNKLVARNGGVVSVSDRLSLPTAGTTLIPDAITLDAGTLRITRRVGVSSASFFLADGSALRGITIGTGGGTIEVVEANEDVIFRRGPDDTSGSVAQLLSGSGTFHKTGPGMIRLGVGNDNFTGKIVVLSGTLEFPSDVAVGAGEFGNALGPAPATLVPDQLTLDGGTLRTNSSGRGRIAPTRGITIGAGGATLSLHDSNSLDFRNPFFGSGDLSIVQGNSLGSGTNALLANQVIFVASSPQFSGTVNVFSGAVLVGANTALGTGTVNLTPQAPILLFGSAGTTLPNNINLNPGSLIDFRVDGGFAGAFILSGNIAGANGFAKNRAGLPGSFEGLGKLVLSGSNTFAGDVFVQYGDLIARSATALGSAAGVTVVNSGATLAFENVGAYANNETIYIAGGGDELPTSLGALQNLAGNNHVPGDVIATAFSKIGVLGGSLRVAGVRGASQVDKIGPGTLTADYYRLSALRVVASTVAVSAKGASGDPAGTTRLDFLTVEPGTTFDITNNAVVVDYDFTSPFPALQALIISAYNNGAWDQPGITSSMANGSQFGVGYTEASDLTVIPATFGTVDSTAVLFRHTRYGDADLDGLVNLNDFNRLAANFGASNTVWSQGNFNFDNFTNLSDFNLLAANFGLSASPNGPTPEDWANLASVVPEPGVGVGILAALGALSRRARRQNTVNRLSR